MTDLLLWQVPRRRTGTVVGTLVASFLASGSNNTPSATETLVAGGTITPASNALVVLRIAYATSGGVFADTPSSVSGFGYTWLPKTFAKPSGGSTRSVACYVAQSSSPTSAALSVTFGYTPDDVTFDLFQITGVQVGSGGLDAVLQVETIPTTTNGTALQGWIQDVQHANNGILALHSVGVNSNTLSPAAGESGWTTLSQVPGAAGTAFSLGAMWRLGSADLSPKMSWTTSGSPQYIGLEIKASDASTRYPLDYVRLRAGQGESSANTASHATGRSVHTDVVTDGTVVIKSNTANFDASFVGAAISGTNIQATSTIQSVASNGREATLSLPTTGSGTITATITGRKTNFTSGRTYLMAIMGVRSTDARVPATVALTGGGSFTLIDSITYDILAIPSASDASLSVWKFTASSTVEDTVAITFPAATTHGACWGLLEVTGIHSSINTANVVKTSSTSATNLPLTMGAYNNSRNGVFAVWGRSAASGTDPIPSEGTVLAIDQSDASNRVMGITFAHSNIAAPDLTFGSSPVAGIAIELVGV